MRRNTIVLTGAALLLTVGAGAQIAAYHHDRPSTSVVRATWSFHPTSRQQVITRAQQIVLGKVTSITAGPPIVTAEPGEPGGVDRIPTQRITVTVVTGYKGTATAGQQLTLFQTGGSVTQQAAPAKGKAARSTVQQVVLEGDPAYRAGEQYLLMLEPGPAGSLRPVSPEGRYRVDAKTGSLSAMVSNPVTTAVTGQRLTALAATLRSN
jgi:hypothetical protein